jgi:hypothetical protein
MQPDQRIKNKEFWPQCRKRRFKTLLITGEIEANGLFGDGIERKLVDIEPSMTTYRLDAVSDGGTIIFGQEHEGRPRAFHLECAHTRCCRGDTDRHVKTKPRLAALGLSSYQADSGLAPQGINKPFLPGNLSFQFFCRAETEGVTYYAHTIPLASVT